MLLQFFSGQHPNMTTSISVYKQKPTMATTHTITSNRKTS